MLTVEKLRTLLSPVVSVYEDHITEKQQVSMPYVVLLEMTSENYFADNQVYQEVIPMQIILHQASRDYTLEASIKTILNDNHIPYEVQTMWDKDYYLYATTFDVNG